jgi:hypothetical protein
MNFQLECNIHLVQWPKGKLFPQTMRIVAHHFSVYRNHENDWSNSTSTIPGFHAGYLYSEDGDQELVTACAAGEAAQVQISFSKGANMNGMSLQGETPLTATIKAMGNLIQSAPSYTQDHIAKDLGRLNRTVAQLLRHGASAHQPNRHGQYPLTLAYQIRDGNGAAYYDSIRSHCKLTIQQLQSGNAQTPREMGYTS